MSSNSTQSDDDRRRSPGSSFARRATLELVVNSASLEPTYPLGVHAGGRSATHPGKVDRAGPQRRRTPGWSTPCPRSGDRVAGAGWCRHPAQESDGWPAPARPSQMVCTLVVSPVTVPALAAGCLPACEPLVDRLPRPIALRQISPGDPGPDAEQDAVEGLAVIPPAATPLGVMAGSSGASRPHSWSVSSNRRFTAGFYRITGTRPTSPPIREPRPSR